MFADQGKSGGQVLEVDCRYDGGVCLPQSKSGKCNAGDQ